MPTIVNINSSSSGINPAFERIHTIELDGANPDSGNFGEVYNCLSINGNPPYPPQAVKILRDNGFGSARQGFETIQKLQRKIRESNAKRAASQQERLETLPALHALPQFNFLGEMDGRQVLGYSANRLDGYLTFSSILQDHREPYLELSMEDRLLLALNLVEGFQALAFEMSFIHADINAPNLLVNIGDCRLAIIDFDSGAVTETPDDKPSTFGKQDNWLAPEIRDQMVDQTSQAKSVKVDRFTDTWSVFIAIHHLLFLYHPLFFFDGFLTTESVGGYLAGYQWPEITLEDTRFKPAAEPVYRYYREQLKSLPGPIVEKLSVSMNQGYLHPTMRVSYKQWELVLRAAQRWPEIVYFTAEPQSIVMGMRTRLAWATSHAHEVFIDHQVGAGPSAGSVEVCPSDSSLYTIIARARNGKSVKSTISVRVWPVPVVTSIQIPTCSIRQRVSLKTLRTPPPQFYLPANLRLPIVLKEPLLKTGALSRYDAARKSLAERQELLQTIFKSLRERSLL